MLTRTATEEIHTFGNVACLQAITGQQLLDALEWGARFAGNGKENGGLLHVSGITCKIDSTYPQSTQADNKGAWIGAPTGGYRVVDVKVYNKENDAWDALDLTASCNLAGYNYTLRDLGDGFGMFDGAVNILDYAMEDYMVLARYAQAFEVGVADAANSPLMAKYPGLTVDYGTVNGSSRIEVLQQSRRKSSRRLMQSAEAFQCAYSGYPLAISTHSQPWPSTSRKASLTAS